MVKGKLSRQALAAIPIKNQNMSIRQLRQLCVDFFRFNKTFGWTPDTERKFIKSSKTMQEDVLLPGEVYSGFPYAMGTGNCYRLFDYMDEETGVVDIQRASRVWRLFASQCSIGAYWGWARVIRSANYDWTQNMVHANGFLRLGEYRYPDDLPRLGGEEQPRTTAICEENGREVMYRSYAKLQLGDGLVYFTTAGHVVMASCDAVVVYNEDGTINGEESYITILDQTNKWVEYENAAGEITKMKANVDAKWNFAYLFDKHYLPFTFAEFAGLVPAVEDTVCTFSHQEETITREQLFSGVVRSNYGIVDAYAIFTDGEGRELYRHAVRAIRGGLKELPFWETEREEIQNLNGSMDRIDFWGTFPTESCNVRIEVQLGTGERPTVYVGKLVVE